MNAICPNQQITTLLPSFMENTTSINPDYDLKSFDPIVAVLKVALIGVIIFGACGIGRIPPYNKMPLRGKVLSAALVAPYLLAVLVGLQAIFSTKGEIDCKILATVVTLTLPVIFSLEIENCMKLARKANIKQQHQDHIRQFVAIWEAAAGEAHPAAAQLLGNLPNQMNQPIIQPMNQQVMVLEEILPEDGDDNEPGQIQVQQQVQLPIELQRLNLPFTRLAITPRCTRRNRNS